MATMPLRARRPLTALWLSAEALTLEYSSRSPPISESRHYGWEFFVRAWHVKPIMSAMWSSTLRALRLPASAFLFAVGNGAAAAEDDDFLWPAGWSANGTSRRLHHGPTVFLEGRRRQHACYQPE
jgi:hypothetical protein